ncbi:MAG: type II toxin-antitoxin system ParD family antitoxin [Acidobacteria bacterium]|nr:type II toxin-antitoxin system ParD family antitoxin [Acidobacteriota bacterium]
MNVALTPELEKLVSEKVRSGMYSSASEVVREALRLLEEQDEVKRLRREELRRKIDAGYEQLVRGEGIPGEQVFASIRERSRQRRRAPS